MCAVFWIGDSDQNKGDSNLCMIENKLFYRNARWTKKGAISEGNCGPKFRLPRATFLSGQFNTASHDRCPITTWMFTKVSERQTGDHNKTIDPTKFHPDLKVIEEWLTTYNSSTGNLLVDQSSSRRVRKFAIDYQSVVDYNLYFLTTEVEWKLVYQRNKQQCAHD